MFSGRSDIINICSQGGVKFSTGGDSKLDKSASATSVDLVKVQNRR